ncbi:MAG TPA: hypothetical protein ENN13_04260 [Candidatus Altiarchaeales archaeon]|nr:hypothetical protein [Candidatus Altiarchaeales archaeon]
MAGKSAGRGNQEPDPPSSRGVPSGETLYLPKHYGVELKEKGGLDKTVFWTVEDVVDFIFPAKYQPKYHRVASDFLKIVLEKDWVTKREISVFLKKTGYSKSTLENKVIPKLVRFGLLKRQREIKSGLGKGRGLILSESLTFTNYLERIGFAWNMLVSTTRARGKNKG